MLGYLAGPRVGAATYDLLHFEGFPVMLGLAGVLAGADVPIQLALIWLTHIGVDRVLGYGLKYPTAVRGHAPPARLALFEDALERVGVLDELALDRPLDDPAHQARHALRLAATRRTSPTCRSPTASSAWSSS